MVFLFTAGKVYQEPPAIHFAYTVPFKLLINDLMR